MSGYAHWLSNDINRALEPGRHPEFDDDIDVLPLRAELVIIDEADRAGTSGLEQLRDFFDRNDIGMILIGMPGFERRLARYPQLYSRIGFAHQYEPLDRDDIPAVLAHYCQQLDLPVDAANPDAANPDGDDVGAIVRITGGNFRLIERPMTQIGRLRDINNLDDITVDLINAARQTLVIGTQ
ncbi:MAG: AAA family ATPase [Nakamurella sp.]